MESNKLTVEEFARKNIGKSFKTFDKDYITPKYEYYRMQLQLP